MLPQVNGFSFCNLPVIILLNIIHLFPDSERVTSIAV